MTFRRTIDRVKLCLAAPFYIAWALLALVVLWLAGLISDELDDALSWRMLGL